MSVAFRRVSDTPCSATVWGFYFGQLGISRLFREFMGRRRLSSPLCSSGTGWISVSADVAVGSPVEGSTGSVAAGLDRDRYPEKLIFGPFPEIHPRLLKGKDYYLRRSDSSFDDLGFCGLCRASSFLGS